MLFKSDILQTVPSADPSGHPSVGFARNANFLIFRPPVIIFSTAIAFGM